MTEELEIAKKIAKECHKGQKDKGGADYILHPLFVSEHCTTYKAKVAALLHDTMEDCGETRESLLARGISAEVVDAVEKLTHKPHEAYFDYVRRAKTDAIAKEVKLADLAHNMDITRIPHPTQIDFMRLEKYRKAKEILEA